MGLTFKYHFLKSGVQFFQRLLSLLLVITSLPVYAQDVKINAVADTTTILIGGQFRLSLEVNQKPGVKVTLPAVADTFSLMEVVRRTAVDSVINEADKSILLKQHFILTSFDSGFHVIPPFVVQYKNDGDTSWQTSESRPLLITVQSVPVDTTKTIKDIKGQIQIPLSWQDALPWIFGILLLIAIGFLLYRWVKNRKKKEVISKPSVPQRPAHEIALEQLAALDQAKLWQQGNFKGYYTALSDITRTFIENRWNVNAMEMTTDEILQLTPIKTQPAALYDELKYLLEISDLAKFAKMTPVVFENEQCMKNALNFVRSNIPTLVEKEVAV